MPEEKDEQKIGPSGLPLAIQTMWMLTDGKTARAVGWTGREYVMLQGSNTVPVADRETLSWIVARLEEIGEAPPAPAR